MSGLPGLTRDYLQELEPHKYYPEKTIFPIEEVKALMQEKFGWSISWSTMGDWFKVVEDKARARAPKCTPKPPCFATPEVHIGILGTMIAMIGAVAIFVPRSRP
jgi:hypothetical protein